MERGELARTARIFSRSSAAFGFCWSYMLRFSAGSAARSYSSGLGASMYLNDPARRLRSDEQPKCLRA